MNPWQKILVIVDPTVSEHPELDKAASLATRCSASLQLFVCATPEARTVLRGDGSELLTTLAMPLRQRGLTVSTHMESAEVLHEGLLACISSTDADLVVKQTHHHSLLQRTLLTHTDWHFIRDCSLPLLLTKEAPWHAAPTVIAAVDPDHVHDKPAALDRAILDIAAQFARHLAGSVHAVHAYLPVAITVLMTEGIAPLAGAITPTAMQQEADAHRQRLRELVQRHALPESALRLVLGTAIEALPRTAREMQADVMVLGAVARSGLARWVLGGTAERVLEHLPCDALIVKVPRAA
jgi:universal stress protein E